MTIEIYKQTDTSLPLQECFQSNQECVTLINTNESLDYLDPKDMIFLGDSTYKQVFRLVDMNNDTLKVVVE